MTESNELKSRVRKEAALLAILVFVGLVVLPLCIYLVGNAVFGEYGNGGFAGFFGALHRKFRAGEPVVWFLMLSPYVLWQLMRLTLWGFRRVRQQELGGRPEKL